jgi:hypothetical protein
MSIKSPGNGGSVLSGGNGSVQTLTLTAVAPTVGASQVGLGGTVSATATAGSATLPTNPVGFIIFNVAGTAVKVPYYAT